MHRCRECERLLLRRRTECPECRARRPEARVVVLARTSDRTTTLPWTAAACGAAVPLLLALDAAARWLLRGG